MPGFNRFREYSQLLRSHFHQYRHAWLAIGLLALLILMLDQAPSTQLHDFANSTPSAPADADSNHNPTSLVQQTEDVTAPPPSSAEGADITSTVIGPVPTVTSNQPDEQNNTGVSHPADSSSPPTMVLIIDDIGNNLAAGMRTLALPGKVTLAVMPYTPHGSRIAMAAHNAGQEIMLHMPMSNQAGMNLGPDGLTANLDKTETVRRLRLALADIPYIKGVNNHTGSELTELTEPMAWVMEELSHHPLYFIDSMTTANSVAFETARQFSIPVLKRHVFLDNVREEAAIHQQFEQAIHIARQEGLAVAIGHPYEETLTYLEKALPALEKAGVTLHFASEILNRG